MTECAIYCRLSRDREADGLGVERQEQDCRALAARLGLTVAQVYVDNDVSASTLSSKRRAQFEAMMAEVEAGRISTILAYSNSRLTRRPMELERLIVAHDRTGVRFHTVVSGQDDLSAADGRMVARIKASVDAAEAERVSERIKRQQQQARAAGRWHGGHRPYGFESDGQTPNATEGAVIARVCQELLDGRSMISRVRDLNDRGLRTSMGKQWSVRTLRRVISRRHPAVEDGIYEAVNALLDDPSRRTTPGPQRRWMLSGVARCGGCGGLLRGSASSRGAGRGTYPAYRCLGPGKHIVISAHSLDEYISMETMARLAQPDLDDLIHPSTTLETLPLRQEAAGLRRRLDALGDDLDIDVRDLARQTRRIRERIEAIEEQLAAAARTTPLAAFANRDPGAILDTWDGLDLERRRSIVDLLMTITIVKGARGVVPREHRWRMDLPAFDPRRVEITWKGQA